MAAQDRDYYSMIVRVVFGRIAYHAKIVEWVGEPYQITIKELRQVLKIADSTEWIGRAPTSDWRAAKALIKQQVLENPIRLRGALFVRVHPAFGEVEMEYYDHTAQCQVIRSAKFLKRSPARHLRLPVPIQ